MKFGSPPAGSGIQLAEASESRVVMVIPPGGKRARGMGFFALVWLAITIPAGLIFLYAANKSKGSGLFDLTIEVG
ncbi:MAG: hypothetical protein ACKVHE_35010 [Planctomycetales bacterium]